MCTNFQDPLHELSPSDSIENDPLDLGGDLEQPQDEPTNHQDLEDHEPVKTEKSHPRHKAPVKQHETSAVFEKFQKEIEEIKDVETKLHKTLEFMKNSLSEGTSPQFKNFWEGKSLALNLFKENVNPALRSILWNQYTDLSKEARQLKEMLDEESAFAAEQIELAIKGIEDSLDLASDRSSDNAKDAYDFQLTYAETLRSSAHFYQKMQSDLNVLNVQATRINALRKELIKTEMRIRAKNKFFQRLSSAGDRVFPLRKELIREISQRFIAEVDGFISHYFQGDAQAEAFFHLRDEIKALQSVAKELTLNTNAFTQTRLKLSECWDKLKVIEKERKKERAQQKSAFRHNADIIDQKINDVAEKFASKEMTFSSALTAIEEISQEMRGVDLGRDEVRYLKDKLAATKKPLLEEKQQEAHAAEREEQLRQSIKREAVNRLFEECDHLIITSKPLTVDELIQQLEAFQSKIASTQLSRNEKADLERRLKPIREAIIEKKESAVLALSDTDRSQLLQLKSLLEERKMRKQEIKAQIRSLRSSIGGSGLDIAQSLAYNEELKNERERLEKILSGIEEVEKKIACIEAKG